MPRVSLWIIMLSVLAMTASSHAADFEGLVRMKMTEGRHAMDMDWYAKADRGRMEMQVEGRTFYWLLDGKNKKWIMPIPDQQLYQEIALDDADVEDDLTFVIVRTGKKDTVAGQACEIVLVKEKESGHATTEACVAKGMGYFMAAPGMAGAAQRHEPAWMKDVREQFKDGSFPLRTIVRSADGREEMRMEATKVERKRLPDTLFTVPPGYKKIDMAEIMRGTGLSRRPLARPGASGDASPGTGDGVDTEALLQGLGELLKKGGGQ